MITFERLLAPAMPVLTEIEQKRSRHFNETYTWMVFVRLLVYHFTMGFSSMRELVTGLRNADPAIDVPALPRSTISQMFTRFEPQLRILSIIAGSGKIEGSTTRALDDTFGE